MNVLSFFAGRKPGLVIIVIGVAGIFLVGDISIGSLSNMGAAFFPILISIGLTILGVVLLFNNHEPVAKINWTTPLVVLAALVTLASGIKLVGLHLSIAGLLMISLAIQRPKHRASGIAYIFTMLLMVHLIFVNWLGIS